MKQGNILIVDDDRKICEVIASILTDENFRVNISYSGEEALEMIKSEPFDLVLLDIWLPGMDGLETLQKIKEIDPTISVIMISGHGSIDSAVKATKLGAFDFIEKPLSLEKLLVIVQQSLKQCQLERENIELKSRIGYREQIIGKSKAIKEVMELIEKAAPSSGRVLIYGENGTGKELVARAIHFKSSRANGPFVEVNCAAIPEELIESELFGHEKGAFTGALRAKKGKFELANTGTIFLDEIGDMSLKTQAKVLRTLEEQKIERVGGEKSIEIDVRVIAASNKNLEELISQKKFREDLFYRLNVIPITVPPLRERVEDIPILAEHFIEIACRENGKRLKKISAEALEILKKYSWPGNVRELKNIIERMVILSPYDLITPQDIPPSIRFSETIPIEKSFKTTKYESLWAAKRDFESKYITSILEANDWNISKAAEELKIQRTNLHRKIKALNIVIPETKVKPETMTEN